MTRLRTLEDWKAELLGCELAEAKETCEEYGFTIRITAIDNNALVVTRDMNRKRVNVKISDNLVVQIFGIG